MSWNLELDNMIVEYKHIIYTSYIVETVTIYLISQKN